MALYSYRYQEPHVSFSSNSKRLYFLFGLTVGLFLFVILLPLSLLIPSNQQVFVSPISANTKVNKEIKVQQLSNETMVPSPTSKLIISTVTATPTPTMISPSKSSYTIAVYGDSMVDTMGERLEYLEHALKKKYPGTNFTLYNFGKGAENVEMGLSRFGSELHYQDRNYSSLFQIRPDIIIIGSFAYNPFTPHDRDRHWLGLTHLVQEAKNLTPNIYLLAEIAPLRKDFGKGPNGVNWDNQTNYEHSGRIIEQLENSIGLAKNLDVGLIDAFHPSFAKASEGKPSEIEGKKEYVNPGDGIHPNVAGHEFMAEKIASTIQLK